MPRNRNNDDPTPDEAASADPAAANETAAKANAPEASTAKATKAAEAGDHDRVVIASRRPDGAPAQTEGYEFIGPKDDAVTAAKTQLREQRVSAADTALRGVTDDAYGGEGRNDPDPYVAPILEAHNSVAKSAESEAESQVNKAHQGLGA